MATKPPNRLRSLLGLGNQPEAEALRRIVSAKAANASALRLDGLALTSISDKLSRALAQLPNLQELYLDSNELTHLPDAFCHALTQLSNLKRLDLDGNQFTQLPDAFSQALAQLPNLKILDLSFNQLTELPDVFSQALARLPNLQTLTLSNNQLTQLPDAFSRALAQLTNLQRLDLHTNQLSQLPDAFSHPLAQLTNLRTLFLNGNRLTELPDAFSHALAQLTNLRTLVLSGNPLPRALLDAAEQGVHQLRAYLRELRTAKVRFWQAKVMLVGEGSHGKTSVLRALIGEEFLENQTATPLLEVKSLPLPHPTAHAQMDLHAWDFGGQDFYYATQQLFFTGKSIFLLVWNPRGNFEQSTVTNWLDRIHALAPDSPVFIVATHADRHKPNVPLSLLREKYPNLQEQVFSVDCKSNTHIDDLREAIRQAASKLDHMGAERPESWVKATESIHKHPEKYVQLEQFREIAKADGVNEVEAYLNQLNLSGEVTFFSRNPIHHPETADLNDWVILKPEWLLQKISSVLTDEVTRKTASFKKPDLQRIWPDAQPFVRDFLSLLMDHFDLAYRVNDASNRHIVVELTKEDRPAEVQPRWDSLAASPKKIALHYKFPIAIPPGLPTWFTARAHAYTKPEHHWRRGALLTDDAHNAALIESELDNKTVKLEARGERPLEFFNKLRICFEDTVNHFPGLRDIVEEVVPCVKTSCPGFARTFLEDRLSMGRSTVECQSPGCYHEHEIANLLYGLTRTKVEEALDILLHRDQSRINSRCPSLFTLELKRLPGEVTSVAQGFLDTLTDKAIPADLTLYCEHPGEQHPVKTYTIQPPGRNLATLAPLMKRANTVLSAVAPMIALKFPGVKVPNMKDLAEAWTDKVSGPMGLIDETRDPRHAFGAPLVALRQILMQAAPSEEHRWGNLSQVLALKSQYLWVCAEHAKHKDYQG